MTLLVPLTQILMELIIAMDTLTVVKAAKKKFKAC